MKLSIWVFKIQMFSDSKMATESSLTHEIVKKKKQELVNVSPESSLTQGDSDSESTSISSSLQGSISSATSSLDQYSSNVKEEPQQKKTLNNSLSKKFASFGSFMSYRRRSQSKLSQSSIKLSDDGSVTPPQSSSIEVSDESSNYVQKTIPKFSRTGSLRSVKILRSKSKNKNKTKSIFKSKNSSFDTSSEISQESHSEKATFSSILKDSKFPEHLKHQPDPLQPEEVLPEAKLCPYQHCSLHGHHHHHEPPQKRFPYLKKRTPKNPKIMKPESQPMDDIKKKKVNVPKKASNEVDPSIEFYAKTRSEEPFSSHGHDDPEFADILFGVNSLQERKNEIPVSESRDFDDVNDKNDEKSNGSTGFLEKKKSLKKTNHLSMWSMIHQHMVSGLAAESSDPILQQVDQETKSHNKDFDDADNQETEIRKMFAIKLVRDAIEKILLPEVQEDQSTTSEVISEQDLSEKNQTGGDRKDEPPVAETVPEEKPVTKTGKGAPNRWSYLKKVILLKRFVTELEKVKKFNLKKPTHIPVSPEPEPETVALRRQAAGDKKNADEWMLDYALQKVVGELAPTQKRKVALLVKAFETVAPGQDDPQESRSEKRVGSETKGKVEERSEIESFDETNVEETKPDLEKEKHIKMWHMIYQHVVTDIATKIGSDLLLDGEESTTSEEKNMQEVEEPNEGKYRLRFTQSYAVKLVQESVNEITSQDTQSVDDYESRKPENDPVITEETLSSSITRFQQQKSKNWSKLKKLILLNRSIKALEGFRKLKPPTPQEAISKNDQEHEKVELRNQMMNEKKKAEQWMLDYAVQHIVTKLTPTRKKRVSMLVEAFEAVVPFPEI